MKMNRTGVIIFLMTIFFVMSSSGQNDINPVYPPYISSFQVDDSDSANTFASPCIAVSVNGDFVVAWEDERGDGINIYAQRYTSEGIPQGDNFRVNDIVEGMECEDPEIALDANGHFIICWNTWRDQVRDFNVYAQRYSSQADRIGGNFRVNDDVYHDHCCEVSVTADQDGNFIIVWREQRDKNFSQIYAQKYFKEGTKDGDNFLVSENQYWQIYPDVAMNSSGDFVVAWADERYSEFDIFAQRFFADGSKNGAEFQVSDVAKRVRKYDPAVSINQSGDFVIAWSHGFGENDICAQYYLADGSRSGDNFQVNLDIYSEFRCSASVSLNDSGQFVIGWLDNDAAHNFYIRYYPSGPGAGEDPFHPAGSNIFMGHYIDLELKADGFLYNVWNANEHIYANIIDLVHHTSGSGTEIEHKSVNDPSDFRLYQNYPNPFNPSTTIDFQLEKTESVQLVIYGITGRRVKTLINERLGSGMHQVLWNGLDDNNEPVPSGVYFCRLETDMHQAIQKMVFTQ
ncbi:T9SS type A sorting domain-containing protein [bacterium]|nr:T9SS type A sorting domain-containing protein [bacterium]